MQLEGPQLLKHGFADAIAKVGLTKFITDLFWVGMFYHLYNQVLDCYPYWEADIYTHMQSISMKGYPSFN